MHDEPLSHRVFLTMGVFFEGGLVLAALALAWLVDVNPFAVFRADLKAFAWGAAAALPMVILFAASLRHPVLGLREIRRFLVETLGPVLAACSWHELILLAAIAGFCEELLFRGVLQVWFTRAGGLAVGVAAGSILFGLAHLITPTYAVLAGVIGVYLGLLVHVGRSPNWCVPAVAHGVYDWLAFLLVVCEYRRGLAGQPASTDRPADAPGE